MEVVAMNGKKDLIIAYCNRFGTMAVKKGYITKEDLHKAMKLQIEEDLNDKRHRLLGMILLDMGLMSLNNIEDVVNELN